MIETDMTQACCTMIGVDSQKKKKKLLKSKESVRIENDNKRAKRPQLVVEFSLHIYSVHAWILCPLWWIVGAHDRGILSSVLWARKMWNEAVERVALRKCQAHKKKLCHQTRAVIIPQGIQGMNDRCPSLSICLNMSYSPGCLTKKQH